MATEPSPAIVAPFVDDDRHPANAGGAKAIERMLDQGPPADRRHRLARMMTGGSPAGRRVRRGGSRPGAFPPRWSFEDLQKVRQLCHGGGNGLGSGRLSGGGLDVFGRDPDEAHGRAPGALAVAAQGIADEKG